MTSTVLLFLLHIEGGIDGNPDFCPQILPYEYCHYTFDETIQSSKGETCA